MKKILFLLVIFGMIIASSCRTNKNTTAKKVEESEGVVALHYQTHIKGRDKNTPELVMGLRPLYVSHEIILSRIDTIRVSGRDENGYDFMADTIVPRVRKINTRTVGTIVKVEGAAFEKLFVSFAVENDPLIYLIWFDKNKNGNYGIRVGASGTGIIMGKKWTISTNSDCHLLYKDNYKKYIRPDYGEADGNPGK